MQRAHFRLPVRTALSLLAWTVLAVGCARQQPLSPAPRPAPAPPASLLGARTGAAAPAIGGETEAVAHPTSSHAADRASKTQAAAGAGGTAAESTKSELIRREVEALIRHMTTAQKVGQLLVLPLFDDATRRYFRDPTKGALRIIHRYHPGGVILFGGNLGTVQQTRRLIRGVQRASRVPLFVALDEEGGTVSRLGESAGMHAVHMPAERVAGAADDPRLVYEEGRYIGRELRSLGINMDLAPVADVGIDPATNGIGSRSYSADPRVVSRLTRAMVRGLQSAEVSSVIKHFPGHGDAVTNPRNGTATVHAGLERLEKISFPPFEAGIAAGADGVMVGHLLLPAILANKHLPASLSPYVIGHILRGTLDFHKIVMTDALNMAAIADHLPAGDAALRAFEAGADMLLMPEKPEAAYRALFGGVKSGTISKKRLDDSLRRILTVKIERGIAGRTGSAPTPKDVIASPIGRRIRARLDAEAAQHQASGSR